MSSEARGCGAASSSRSTSARHATTRLRHAGHADTVAASRSPVTAKSADASAASRTTSSPSSSSTTRSARGSMTGDGSVTAMRAVTVSEGDLQWRDHPDPEPGARELLVAVKAAGLNGADMVQRRGLYAAPPDSPADIPGLELAGEVVGIGPGVEHFVVGDRVMAVVGGGGQAELAVVHERTAL